MNFLDLKDISERYMELINPATHEKVVTVGEVSGLKPGSRVIDFGCGFGEALVLWAEYFGAEGVGIDIREYACQRARQKIAEKRFEDRIQIVCASGADYRFEPHSFDVAACIGATFIWGGFVQTIRATKQAIKPDGKLILGEPYWLKEPVPAEYASTQSDVLSEYQLLQLAQKEDFDVEYVVRANHDDWDRYESSNWLGLLRWIEEHPEHPERQQVIDHLHESQEEYFRYAREYFGWAIYVLNPVKYG